MAEATAIAAAERLAPRRKLRVLRKLARHRSFLVGGAIMLLLVIAALAAPFVTSFDPLAMRVRVRFRPPQWDYLFGTDRFGRDIFTRVLYGAQISLWIGLGTTLLSGLVGAAIGVIAAQFRALDAPLMRLMDALMAFPAILLAIGLAAALGTGITNLIIALAVAYMPRTARLVRASALVVRELEFVDAARVAGAGHPRIMLQHLLPNCMGPLLVQLTFVFAYAILAEAALSFLGIGVPPPAPSWGNIVAEGRDFAVEAWWIMLFPGLAISLAALGMNLLGDGLRDVLDPRLKVEG